jgi:hypothetical protein
MVQEVYCVEHPLTRLVCPRCIAAKGGKTTVAKYGREQAAKWGAKGGRPRKRKARKRKPKTKS